MKLSIRTLAIFISLPFPIVAHAKPLPNWDGPACEDYKVCSVDPRDSNEISPCYASYFEGYSPTQIELDLVAICQAAKKADTAVTSSRSAYLTRVIGLNDELAADINSDPNDAEPLEPTIRGIGQDMQTLEASMVTYSGSKSDQDWQDVSNNLETLALDVQIRGSSD